MKKTFILFVGLLIAFSAFAQEKYKAQWSIALDAGLNRFDGDVSQDFDDIMPNSTNSLTFGASVERTLTPVWSLGIDYFYIPISADQMDKSYYKFETQSHNATFFTSCNLIKAFFPHTTSRWGIWANAGLGYSAYDVDYQTTLDDDGTPKWVRGGNGGLHLEKDKKYSGRAMTIPVGALFEYNLTKSFALGLRYQYRSFNKDNLDGRNYQGVTNDFTHLATLSLRVKLNAQKESHTRNPIQANNYATQNEVNELRNQINGIVIPPPAGPDPRIDDIEKRVKKLEDILCPDGPDTDADGVPDCRDKEPDTALGNQVDFWGRTIPKGTQWNEEAFIYFDFDKTNLDEEAHKAIQIAAQKLAADPELMVEVRGFTDNMGSNTYNADLSQRRAEVVKAALVETYGVEEGRIVANGKGKYNSDDQIIPYRPYRTAAFFYSK